MDIKSAPEFVGVEQFLRRPHFSLGTCRRGGSPCSLACSYLSVYKRL